jgi:hypothetical protein
MNTLLNFSFSFWGLGIGDWGLGIGPNPQSPNFTLLSNIFINLFYILNQIYLNIF